MRDSCTTAPVTPLMGQIGLRLRQKVEATCILEALPGRRYQQQCASCTQVSQSAIQSSCITLTGSPSCITPEWTCGDGAYSWKRNQEQRCGVASSSLRGPTAFWLLSRLSLAALPFEKEFAEVEREMCSSTLLQDCRRFAWGNVVAFRLWQVLG